MKKCTGCQEEKPLSEFYIRKDRGTHGSRCKACLNDQTNAWAKANREQMTELARQWRHQNRDKVRASAKKESEKQKEYVRNLKQTTSCMDCERLLHYSVMEFDHRPGEEKLYNIGDLTHKSRGMPQLLAEIAKCDLVCAICHAHRTYCRHHNIPWYPIPGYSDGVKHHV